MDKLPKSLTTVTPLSKAVAMVLFIALPFIGFYLGMQYQKSIEPYLGTQQLLNERLDNKDNIVNLAQEETTFSDPRVDNVQFIYDPNYWKISLTQAEDVSKNVGGVGILVSELNGNGVIDINYNLPFGVGGGFSLIHNIGDMIEINDEIVRVWSKDNNAWFYGSRSAAHLFGDTSDTSNPDEVLNKYLCPPEGTPPQQGNLGDEICDQIREGKIVGYTDFPAFGSFTREPGQDFDSVQEGWEKLLINYDLERVIIMRVKYSGESPEIADEIVRQILK